MLHELKEDNPLMSYFHDIALSGIFLLSIIFAITAIIIKTNALAILIEYLLFGWIVFIVPVWVVILLVHNEKIETLSYKQMQEREQEHLFPDSRQSFENMSIYDLKIEI
jgi:hypothetical protein